LNDILAIIVPAMSTIMTGVLVLGVRWLWVRVRKFLNEGRTELVDYMQRIETQTTQTNGRVTKIEMDAQHERLISAERFARIEATVETMKLLLASKPPS
jgi:hypothetical protein